jgi:hypothetical protein
MILAIDMKNYSLDNVFFNEQQKNSINDTNFIRLIYSSKIFSLHGICISLNLSILSLEDISTQNNKYKCIFSITKNNHIIQFIKELEYNLLKQVSLHPYHINKTPNYKLFEHFQNGEIKVIKHSPFLQFCKKNNYTIIIKISGIWSSNDFFGLTYRLSTPN